jgi:Golgi SNAP receptor complex protein 1
MMHTLQRHRDVLLDYRKEFKRIKSTIMVAKERQELLGSVRDDIRFDFIPNRMCNSFGGMNRQFKSNSEHSSQMETLLSERKRVDNVGRMTDSVIK